MQIWFLGFLSPTLVSLWGFDSVLPSLGCAPCCHHTQCPHICPQIAPSARAEPPSQDPSRSPRALFSRDSPTQELWLQASTAALNSLLPPSAQVPFILSHMSKNRCDLVRREGKGTYDASSSLEFLCFHCCLVNLKFPHMPVCQGKGCDRNVHGGWTCWMGECECEEPGAHADMAFSLLRVTKLS